MASTASSSSSSSSSSPPAFRHLAQQQQTFNPPLIANDNAFLGDVQSNDDVETSAPMSCGTPLVYTYTYHEMKIILEGSFDISDETGQKVHGTKGDVFYFPEGAKITFTTEEYGLAFYTGQRKRDSA